MESVYEENDLKYFPVEHLDILFGHHCNVGI